VNGRIVLRVIPKPPIKPSNILVNWILFFATIATTFVTGYMLSSEITDPFLGGATFTIALMTVLGLHEVGHKITANRKGVEATPPYFIPGPPPIGNLFGIGTFGAVIMQKSLPPNKDALFDIGSSGPILSFILATVATTVGLLFSPPHYSAVELPTIPVPLLFWLIAEAIVNVPPGTPEKPYAYILLHPVAVAGWVGMVVTMLNLLPAAMLDGGHVARSLVGEKTRSILTFLSILLLIVEGFWPMAFFVLFMSMYRHPGPLDDVSSLSKSRKFLIIVLIVILVLSSFLHYLVYALFELLGL
jgi:membrane-associated protease RseP (regulator of RpoE activity)